MLNYQRVLFQKCFVQIHWFQAFEILRVDSRNHFLQLGSLNLKQTWNITMSLMGKSTISTGPCSIIMLVYQRVNPIKSHKKPSFSYRFPMVFLWFSYGFLRKRAIAVEQGKLDRRPHGGVSDSYRSSSDTWRHHSSWLVGRWGVGHEWPMADLGHISQNSPRSYEESILPYFSQ